MPWRSRLAGNWNTRRGFLAVLHEQSRFPSDESRSIPTAGFRLPRADCRYAIRSRSGAQGAGLTVQPTKALLLHLLLAPTLAVALAAAERARGWMVID